MFKWFWRLFFPDGFKRIRKVTKKFSGLTEQLNRGLNQLESEKAKVEANIEQLNAHKLNIEYETASAKIVRDNLANLMGTSVEETTEVETGTR